MIAHAHSNRTERARRAALRDSLAARRAAWGRVAPPRRRASAAGPPPRLKPTPAAPQPAPAPTSIANVPPTHLDAHLPQLPREDVAPRGQHRRRRAPLWHRAYRLERLERSLDIGRELYFLRGGARGRRRACLSPAAASVCVCVRCLLYTSRSPPPPRESAPQPASRSAFAKAAFVGCASAWSACVRACVHAGRVLKCCHACARSVTLLLC